MTLKKCMREYVLCQQLSCQNFSFYFVLNLDTGPLSPYDSNYFDVHIGISYDLYYIICKTRLQLTKRRPMPYFPCLGRLFYSGFLIGCLMIVFHLSAETFLASDK